MTITPASTSRRIDSISITRSGSGEGTTRRQPAPSAAMLM